MTNETKGLAQHIETLSHIRREYVREGGGFTLELAALDAARDALLALAARREDGWRPIETAPRDGSIYLCFVDASRFDEDEEGRLIETNTSDVDFGQWREFDDGGFHDNMMGKIGDQQLITHWMPLPTAPEGREAATPPSHPASETGTGADPRDVLVPFRVTSCWVDGADHVFEARIEDWTKYEDVPGCDGLHIAIVSPCTVCNSHCDGMCAPLAPTPDAAHGGRG